MAERERRQAPPYGGVFAPRTRVMDSADVQRAVWRMAHEAIEANAGFDDVALEKYHWVEKINHVHHAGNSSGIVDGAGLLLVGEVIRRVTGLTVNEALQREIVRPLGLEALEGGRHRVLVGVVHRVGARVRVIHRQGDDALFVALVTDHVLAHGSWFLSVAQMRSTMVAMPIPPPMQRVAMPRLRSRRSSSSTRVPRIIAPVAPSG